MLRARKVTEGRLLLKIDENYKPTHSAQSLKTVLEKVFDAIYKHYLGSKLSQADTHIALAKQLYLFHCTCMSIQQSYRINSELMLQEDLKWALSHSVNPPWLRKPIDRTILNYRATFRDRIARAFAYSEDGSRVFLDEVKKALQNGYRLLGSWDPVLSGLEHRSQAKRKAQSPVLSEAAEVSGPSDQSDDSDDTLLQLEPLSPAIERAAYALAFISAATSHHKHADLGIPKRARRIPDDEDSVADSVGIIDDAHDGASQAAPTAQESPVVVSGSEHDDAQLSPEDLLQKFYRGERSPSIFYQSGRVGPPRIIHDWDEAGDAFSLFQVKRYEL